MLENPSPPPSVERLAETIKGKDNSPSSTFSSTVHTIFVVFPHIRWLRRYSFFGDKLDFTNTGKFFGWGCHLACLDIFLRQVLLSCRTLPLLLPNGDPHIHIWS